jgi:hypothetical protein
MERTPPRSRADDGAASATRPSGGRFRYRLVDLSGSEVAGVQREQALRADDVVVVRSPRGEATWRVVGVLGTTATVVPAPRPDTPDT